MPTNGEMNVRFGVYKTSCCGAEIVIAEGVFFPDCPNHPKFTTLWKPIRSDRTRADDKPDKDSAA